jgi:phosphoglycolate phosphatase-like HAD superfamily hydrolase
MTGLIEGSLPLQTWYPEWRVPPVAASDHERKQTIMIRKEEVLAALENRAVYALQVCLDPSNKSTDALQELLLRMRAAGKVKFDMRMADGVKPDLAGRLAASGERPVRTARRYGRSRVLMARRSSMAR